jgi:uncharacterized protein YcbX
MQQLTLSGLYVYPVKSLKGIPLQEAELTGKGLLHDRRWMVVRPEGRFVTQREEPRLALVHTRLDERGATLWREGHGSVFLPFAGEGGARIQTRVWGDDCEAEDVGEEAARWLTAAVGSDTPYRLVRMAAGFQRPPHAGARFGAGTIIDFADAAPLLVTFEASLEVLNRELQAGGHAAVPMNRFRPNLVIGGLEPFAEHGLTRLAGDGWEISLVDRCERCLVPTVDQQTGVRDPAREPYMTLRRINPMPGPKGGPAFGVNARVASGTGRRIAVGAAVAAGA